MWVRDNKVWYEAELIEDLVRLCKTEIALDNWGKYFAEKILKIIQENEG